MDDIYFIDDCIKCYYMGIDLVGLSDEEACGDYFYEMGVFFQDVLSCFNVEIQYNESFGGLELIVGVQWQQDCVNFNGIYFIENEFNLFWDGDYIVVNQYGVYVYLIYNFGGGFKVIGVVCYDYYDVYEVNFVLKFGLLKIGDYGSWCLIYGQGIVVFIIFNMFGDFFSGLILGNVDGFILVDGMMVFK